MLRIQRIERDLRIAARDMESAVAVAKDKAAKAAAKEAEKTAKQSETTEFAKRLLACKNASEVLKLLGLKG